ncbi:MAG TPA: hypothetical protein DDW23_04515 [Planctomycetes bacterium]|nr:hypothetical protein [Planctomycetota bacterium]
MDHNPKALEGILEFCDQLRTLTEKRSSKHATESKTLEESRAKELRTKALEDLPSFGSSNGVENLEILELLVLALLFHRRTIGSMESLRGGEIVGLVHSAGLPRTKTIEALGKSAGLRKNRWISSGTVSSGLDPLEQVFAATPKGLALFLPPNPSVDEAEPEPGPYANEEAFLWDLYRWRNLCLQRAEALFDAAGENSELSNRGARADKAARDAWLRSRKRLGLTPGAREFAIERFRRKYRLGEDDLLVVLHLLFSELIEVEPFLPALECLRVVTSTRNELIRRRHSLSEGSRLRESDIVMVRNHDYGKDRAVLFGLSDWATEQILAGVDGPPRLRQGELDEFLSSEG